MYHLRYILLLFVSVVVSSASAQQLHLWHKHRPDAPYVPQPDALQHGVAPDTPASDDNSVISVNESTVIENLVSSSYGTMSVSNTSVVRAVKGSTLSIDGFDVQQLYVEAMKYLGYPYRSGASGPRSFDCSGFTSYVYKSLNIQLSRSSRDQYLEGIPIQVGSLRVGDLVFFARGGKHGRISHVGMVCEVMPDGNFKFVHACSRGVSIDNFGTAAYYQSRYVGARRIIKD